MDCRITAELGSDEAVRLDNFLANSRAAAHQQRVFWPRVAPITRLQHFRYLVCEEDGKFLLAAVVRFTRLFPSYQLAVITRGPVVQEVPDLEKCLPQMMDVLRKAGASTVLIDPHWRDKDADDVCSILADHGLQVVGQADRSSYAVTGYVDLTRPEEDIFAGFKSRCRRHIRRAARQGLTIRPVANEQDIARFDTLYHDFARRKKLDIAGKCTLLDQWRYVQRAGGAFLLAEVNGRLVGGHVVFREGERAVWVTMASEQTPSDMPRSYNLLWEAMRQMKDADCRDFDLAGLSPNGSDDAGQKNRDFFKLSFSPRPVYLVPIHVATLRPLRHAIFFAARQAYRRSRLRHFITPLLKR